MSQTEIKILNYLYETGLKGDAFQGYKNGVFQQLFFEIKDMKVSLEGEQEIDEAIKLLADSFYVEVAGGLISISEVGWATYIDQYNVNR